MQFFLRLKHWQLFGLLIGVPVVFQIITMGALLSSGGLTYFFLVFPVLMIFMVAVYFGWFYALGTNLYLKLPPAVSMNLTRFKIFLLIPILYMGVFGFVFAKIFIGASNGVPPNPAMLFAIVPLQLFCMFCILYCLYFNAKALKAVELQRPVIFSDFAGEFLLLWFFPIGVWILQPRINQLFDTTGSELITAPEV